MVSTGSNREGSSTTGDKISDSCIDEGQDSTGNSCPSTVGTDAANTSTKTTNTDSTTEEKVSSSQTVDLNNFKQNSSNNNNSDNKHNINGNSLGDHSSDRTSGSVCDSSFSRSSDNKPPGALGNLSSSLSSSNNNSDQNSETDLDGGSKHWPTTDREQNKPQQITVESLNLTTGSKIGVKKKRTIKSSSQDKNETVTNSSDSDSAVLKLAACNKESSESFVNNTVSLSVYRRALQQAVEGLPMDADEALALEEIVAENQRLIKFSK